ncbi:MAG: TrmH family RNA methyltransferase [Cyanobacteria bacterium J06621_3]
MIEFIFILVEPGEPGNIGAAARALHTMGFTDLRFVRPQADVLSEVARAFAHGSVHLLESAPIYKSLQAAVVDVDVVCGCTARHRIEKYHYVSVRELPEVLQEKGDRLKKVAIVFGSERSGLSNQDVDLCDIVTTIPQAVAQPSLNLAQAVMVYSFTLAEQQTQIQIKDQRLNTEQMPVEQYARLKDSLSQLMERIGLSERYQGYVRKALSRLGYEDLYLVQNIRTLVNNKLNALEKDRTER